MKKLDDCRVAILATDGFEESELLEPRMALEDAGAVIQIVSLKTGKIKSWKDGNWGDEIDVDKTVDSVSANEFDALLIPGGVINPDKLRRDKHAVQFVKDFYQEKKPIAAICHGPWMLIEAGISNGLHCTSFSSIKTDLKNSGANWSDEAVVTDHGVVTSRNPGDLPAFNKKIVEEFAEGKHKRMEVK